MRLLGYGLGHITIVILGSKSGMVCVCYVNPSNYFWNYKFSTGRLFWNLVVLYPLLHTMIHPAQKHLNLQNCHE